VERAVGTSFLDQPLRACLCALLVLTSALYAARSALGEEPATTAQPIPCPSGPLTQNCRGEDFDYFVSGDPRAARSGATRFGIILMGGGGSVESAYRSLAERAGRGHIVVLRATADHSFDVDDGELGPLFLGAWGPTVSCQTFTFHSRAAAFDPRVIAALRHADGVFLAGGDQSNYVRYWKATPVQAALNALVKRAAPIGGSSAGLAILGHYSYTAFDGGSLESKVAFADPLGPAVTLEDDFLHLQGLENVITDTHFSARSRLGRLIVFVARINRGQPAQRRYGVGLDERTAVIVESDGTGRVVEGSEGSAWVVTLRGAKITLTRGLPFSSTDVQIVQMGQSSVLRVRSGLVERPALASRARIEAGTAIAAEPLKSMMMRNKVPPGED
jgi:cyanophycinase